MSAPSGSYTLPATLVVAAATLLSWSCGGDRGAAGGQPPVASDALFTRLPSSHTGVRFENRVEDRPDFNIFTYRNYYNGGGVALGDLTGDGLPELMLTSNLDEDRLYLNEGAFRFRDITREAGVGGGAWSTGVTFADVNGDGWLDIYVGHAGDGADGSRANQLFIHRGVSDGGVPRFMEIAAEYGIDDPGYTTHSTFFDYDRDGDLDLYVVNNSPRPANSFGLLNTREVRDSLGGDRLYRNDGHRFVDVSEAAGIFQSEIGFGLGVGVSDIDRDGWPDIYVANDFFEQDYLYLNDGDGTFTEAIAEWTPYTSYSSMGLDIADIDNDGWPDAYVTDMLPEGERRFKMTQGFESWDLYQDRLKNGYHAQFTRNVLLLNQGVGRFAEIGQLAGVARTDWSWSALIADFDLDGLKDIHVTNGIRRDVTSRDYIAYLANPRTLESARRGEQTDVIGLIELLGSTPLPNYALRNRGDGTFADESVAWGLGDTGFSNGAAYGDLDGDGALDLVVNNVDAEASIYRNDTRTMHERHVLRIRLEGTGSNRFGVGARVTVASGEHAFVQELYPSRGFQSSVDYTLAFGLGSLDRVDSVTVEWPDGRIGVETGVPVDEVVTIRQTAAAPPPATGPAVRQPLLSDVTAGTGLDFVHQENEFVDFHRERLLPKLLSTEGPMIAVGDVDGDGLDDVYIGGAKEQPGRLFVQRADATFRSTNEAVFEADRMSEDVGAAFFDATGDGRLDLYVVSGGNEYSDSDPALRDRLYLNAGAGRLRVAEDALPPSSASGSRPVPHDFDGDGDIDLFVGGRVVPWQYGLDPRSVLLQNDGRGRFTDVTDDVAPGLSTVGMVTDAVWEDVDGDGRRDLVVVGEWMPITWFRNTGIGKLERTPLPGLEWSHGWWNRIVPADVTGDGRIDFLVGNLGLNTRLRATEDEPLTMHVKDFDRNGFLEQILSAYNDGISYPLVLRDELIGALPSLRDRFPDFESYASATIADILPAGELADAVVKTAYTLASALVRNEGDGSYALIPLPFEAQIAPVYGILPADVDRDGHTDILLAGNFDGVKPEIGRMAGGYGSLLLGDGEGGFEPVPASESGFEVPGQTRDIRRVRTPRGDLYVVARNDDRARLFRATRSY